MSNFKKLIVVVMAVSFLAMLSSPATAIILPDPTQTYAIDTGGSPAADVTRYLAWAHDDFWSYSATFLEGAQAVGSIPLSYGNYATAFKGVGSGTLDVLLYTGAAGQSNVGVGPGGAFTFEDPVYDAGGNNTNFTGWWGQSDPTNSGTPVPGINGPVTVGNVLDYLHAFDPNNSIPVFGLDLNQTGSQMDMGFVGCVRLVDTKGTASTLDDVVVATFALDENPQPADPVDPNRLYNADPLLNDQDKPGFSAIGDYNPDAPATAIYFSGGGGELDYVAYAPMMNLALYSRNLLFVTEFRMGDYYGMPALNNGPEEIYLLGGYAPQQVPEPAILLLLGLGLVGLASASRKFRS